MPRPLSELPRGRGLDLMEAAGIEPAQGSSRHDPPLMVDNDHVIRGEPAGSCELTTQVTARRAHCRLAAIWREALRDDGPSWHE